MSEPILDKKPIIGFSIGDYNGVGPEVILKTVANSRINKLCTPVIYGSTKVLNRYKQLFDMKDWQLFGIAKAEQANTKAVNILNCWNDQATEIEPGKITQAAGQAAFEALKRATDDLKNGSIDALVTAPINKHTIQSDAFKFPGHTEFLAKAFGVPDVLMLLVSQDMRVGVLTGHIPLEDVKKQLSTEKLTAKIALTMQVLRQDFGILKPKIAVLGLNPHAGDGGLLGTEEQDIISPVLQEFRNKGSLVFGPFSADGFFGTMQQQKFDAVLAMYHDQGLIPFKTLAFESGVNYTGGLPAVRTSPDHGTAYDIAGKNQANENSMLQAVFIALDVLKTRKETLMKKVV